MSTIFVQIASYRDRELVPTLRDCLAKAARPHDLRFGICWQRDETESLEEFTGDPRFRVIAVHYRDSKGACWARNALQSLYMGETYTLQLDSHHRFAAGWDESLIRMLEQTGSDKPLLTTYAPAYDPGGGPPEETPWVIGFDRFSPEGLVLTRPRRLAAVPDRPIPARFYSAHFAFAPGRFCEEVRHDPNLYFHGEEITIAVRAFTHGYELFHPHRVLLWHEYTREARPKHWTDHVAANGVRTPWHLRDMESQRRCRRLLGIEAGAASFGEYGLGPARTLDEYQRYAGIHFALRLVQGYTLEGGPPPNPEVYGIEEWRARCLKDFATTITLDRDRLPGPADVDFWYVGVHDAGGVELYRRDLSAAEVRALLGLRVPTFAFRYRATVHAASWTLWPHSRRAGWLTKISGPVGR